MKFAADFRRSAREALYGKWGLAVLAGFIASLLGATSSRSANFSFNLGGIDTGISLDNLKDAITSDLQIGSNGFALIFGLLSIILIVSLVIGIVMFVISSVVGVGYSKFNLELVDKKSPSISNLFSYFPHWQTVALTEFLKGIYVFLWSLPFIITGIIALVALTYLIKDIYIFLWPLLFIPGIIASYSYMMTPYILADNPELSASEAIKISKQMMRGNRWRLFCLKISFFGWSILCILTLGIGFLWLTPYMNAAIAEFYREISGTRHEFNENVEPQAEETYVVYE